MFEITSNFLGKHKKMFKICNAQQFLINRYANWHSKRSNYQTFSYNDSYLRDWTREILFLLFIRRRDSPRSTYHIFSKALLHNHDTELFVIYNEIRYANISRFRRRERETQWYVGVERGTKPNLPGSIEKAKHRLYQAGSGSSFHRR